MAEEAQDETPLERYRSNVRRLIDVQYNKWNDSISNTPNKIQKHEVTDELRGGNEVEDFINICNFLEEHEQQEYLEGKKGSSASKGTDDKENTFRDFLIFLFSRKQVIDRLGRVTNLEPIDLDKVISSEITDIEDVITETRNEIKEKPNHLEKLKIDEEFLKEKQSNLSELSKDTGAKRRYISKNPILNFFISEEQRPSLVKNILVDDANLPDDIANLISSKYVLETDLKPAQEISTNLKRKHENDNAVNAFNRRKSKKGSRRNCNKSSRRKSRKESRRKSRKESRKKSKKESRRKSRKESRRKSRKESRRKSKKESRKKSKKESRKNCKKSR
jgi:predicted ribosome quality control (RQC) complex YloA/Tae2 family protein